MKLSVAMITYNHDQYIAQAIESVLAQITNFNFELVIGEDCSSDDTRNIVFEYKKKYTDRIRMLLHDENIGMNRNFISTIDNCRGQYIAYLEGDDYWTSQSKLQKQVEMLEENPEYSFSFHLVKKEYTNNTSEGRIFPGPDKRKDLTFDDLLPYDCTHLSSIVFPKNRIKEWPSYMYKTQMMDWPLRLLLLENGGKAGFLNEVMSVYRIHGQGVHSKDSQLANLIKSLEALKLIKKNLKTEHRERINYSIYLYYSLVAKEYYKQKKHALLFNIISKMLIMKLLYIPLVITEDQFKTYWLDYILNDIYKKTNSIGKIFIKIIFLIKNFFTLIATEGLTRALSRVFAYLFLKKQK